MKQKGAMEDSDSTATEAKHRLSIHLPKSKKEVYDLFNLSRTNQILRGRSPVISPTLPEVDVSAVDASLRGRQPLLLGAHHPLAAPPACL